MYYITFSCIRDLKKVYHSLYTSIDCSEKTKETLTSLIKVIIFIIFIYSIKTK